MLLFSWSTWITCKEMRKILNLAEMIFWKWRLGVTSITEKTVQEQIQPKKVKIMRTNGSFSWKIKFSDK